MPCVQSLGHAWLAAPRPGPGEDVVIRTENLRKYLARRRWLRCGQAIRAVTRLSSELCTALLQYPEIAASYYGFLFAHRQIC